MDSGIHHCDGYSVGKDVQLNQKLSSSARVVVDDHSLELHIRGFLQEGFGSFHPLHFMVSYLFNQNLEEIYKELL